MTSCGAFYLLLSLLLYAIRFWGYHTVIISEFLVLFFWSSMVMLMLFWDLFMTPPGELSSFLSSIHMPTGVILGLMVIFRFFPTMKAELKAVGLSMKNRGLTLKIGSDYFLRWPFSIQNQIPCAGSFGCQRIHVVLKAR